MFKMWEVWDVEFLGYEKFRRWDDWDMGCVKCRIFGISVVGDVNFKKNFFFNSFAEIFLRKRAFLDFIN